MAYTLTFTPDKTYAGSKVNLELADDAGVAVPTGVPVEWQVPGGKVRKHGQTRWTWDTTGVQPGTYDVIARIDGEEVARDPYDLEKAPYGDRKSTRLNSSHNRESRMPSSA